MKCVLIVLVIFSLSSHASEGQGWSSFQMSSTFKEDYSIIGELLNRYSFDKKEFVTRSVRMGIGYKINPSLRYTLIFENRTSASDANDENRYIHQLQKKWSFEPVDLSMRGRLEHREFSDSSSFQHRVRGLARVDGTGFVYWNVMPFLSFEYLYITNTVSDRPSGSYEMRNSVGLSTKISDLGVEASYTHRVVTTAEFESNPEKSSYYNVYSLNLRLNY